MKKSTCSSSDNSKSSFFNDGNQLFTTSSYENLHFVDQGIFQMTYQKKIIIVTIYMADSILKISDEKSDRYIDVENICLKGIINQKNKQFGFRLSKNGQYAEFFGIQLEILNKIKIYMIQSDFQSKYKVIKKVGSGYLSQVYKAQNIMNGQEFAVKIYEKSNLIKSNSYERELCMNEIRILRQINHKGLLKLYEIFEGELNIYIVTELLEGGPIKQYIINQDLTEQDMMKIMKSLFISLNYLHKLNIYHTDIRFDNIILRDPMDLESVCLINYGKAVQIPQRTKTLDHMTSQEEGALKFYMKKDIYSLSIIMLSIFTQKFYQENQLVDELLMKNFKNISYIEYMELSPPFRRFFEMIFTEKYQKQIDSLNCENILELDVFKQLNKPRNSKILISQQLANGLARRTSKYAPRFSQREKLEQSLNIIKLPPINGDTSTSTDKSYSPSPQSDRFISNQLTNILKARHFYQRKNALKQNILI
ncbi:unnamed protein product (macronuclear) [Paramecium tetraurelia]|uniref:Protein kinase domain-containing protein n=1 Tax=Paramecium tetraurelia TaxID=5888 RepID=A0DFZ8_PARTE|nr:uncharacterized protein GSPATT00002093001 [Paramecium tetraurelia]CAK81965.1 unnamed protein product [Paramecium tetraurelia]|eukprot:XP_001449362.1 hypothetical protein (macronuclear) [Paramecium tetraurelia strain d4-2]